jgi:transposase
MIRICLPADQLQPLQRLFRTTDDRTLRDRLQVALMAQRGRPHQQIAADLGVSPRTVQPRLNAFLERGLDGRRPRQAPGAAPRLTADLAPLLQRWVLDGPAACGLDRANWTDAELADHLFKTHGVLVRKSAMQVFCRKHGIRPFRPTYRFLRGDPAQQAAAREDRAALKKKPRRANSSC